MPVLVIIGDDGSGKSTLIAQLKEKYKLDSIAFPTPQVKQELEKIRSIIDYEDIHSVLNYHMRFVIDFMEHLQIIQDYVHSKEDLLLVDRYIYCSLAYLRHDVLKNHSLGYWEDVIRPILWGIYEYNIINTAIDVIWLRKKGRIDYCYELELASWFGNLTTKYDDFTRPDVSISGLKEDTFLRVETLLKERGYLKDVKQ